MVSGQTEVEHGWRQHRRFTSLALARHRRGGNKGEPNACLKSGVTKNPVNKGSATQQWHAVERLKEKSPQPFQARAKTSREWCFGEEPISW
jgi:hypothetical protein